MSTTDRPGGLTALAVINFIFFGFDVLAALLILGLMVLQSHFPNQQTGDTSPAISSPASSDKTTDESTEENRATAHGSHMSKTVVTHQERQSFSFRVNGKRQTREQLGISLLGSVVCATLLLLSGIGYLRQSRIMGRYLGSAYAAAALLLAIMSSADGLSVFSIIAMVYPMVTLVMVNAVFNHDLVH